MMTRCVMPKKSASAKVTTLVTGLALVIAVGLIGYQPLAQAVSNDQLSGGVQTGATNTAASGTISFLLGEDGAIWYTVTNPGAQAANKTGNSDNPFDQGTTVGAPSGCAAASQTATCNGFVSSTGLAGSCIATGDTCSNIFARTPGAGTFQDSPTVQRNTPISSTNANIMATGLDNSFYYTLFDIAGTGTAATMGGGVPGKDPFSLAGESGNTAGAADGNGFVNQTSLAGQCIALTRTCVGIWVKVP